MADETSEGLLEEMEIVAGRIGRVDKRLGNICRENEAWFSPSTSGVSLDGWLAEHGRPFAQFCRQRVRSIHFVNEACNGTAVLKNYDLRMSLSAIPIFW